jgi:RNA polymerase sigma factor (TIGR02999 family)
MANNTSPPITQLLIDWGKGNDSALDELMPIVYQELRRIAHRHIRKQSAGHTFQTTDLIHEAYLKIASGGGKHWRNRVHFFAVASKAMRHILVDQARSKQREKRGGQAAQITLEDNLVALNQRSDEIIRLDEALTQLALLDKRKSQVVEMKFFGGLNFDEIADVLNVSTKTVKRDWQFSRTWLLRELADVK